MVSALSGADTGGRTLRPPQAENRGINDFLKCINTQIHFNKKCVKTWEKAIY